MTSLTLRANAKINLALDLFHRRDDGYHEVVTVLHEIALHDLLTFERSPDGGSLRVWTDDDRLPRHGENLVGQALLSLWRELPRHLRDSTEPWPGLQVRIKKRIPVGAGLGGGSANAAAALRAVPRLWNLELAPGVLQRAAAQVGADVPFFLYGGTAAGVGTGSRILPLAVPKGFTLPVLLVLPPRGLSTARVFQRHQEFRSPYFRGSMLTLMRGLWEGNRSRIAKSLHNGLEPAAEALYADLASLKQALQDAGVLGAAMTGSGSTFFAIPKGWRQAASAAAAVRDRLPDARIVLTRSAAHR